MLTPAQKASEEIIEILLRLSPPDRADAFQSVRLNGVFCVGCGFGSPERPNQMCHCGSDE